MTIAVQQDFDGVTLAQYDAVVAKMGLPHNGTHSEAGLLFHFVVQTDNGIRVTDVWESRAGFEKFAQEKIGPISQEVGFPGPPAIVFTEVHNYNTAG